MFQRKAWFISWMALSLCCWNNNPQFVFLSSPLVIWLKTQWQPAHDPPFCELFVLAPLLHDADSRLIFHDIWWLGSVLQPTEHVVLQHASLYGTKWLYNSWPDTTTPSRLVSNFSQWPLVVLHSLKNLISIFMFSFFLSFCLSFFQTWLSSSQYVADDLLCDNEWCLSHMLKGQQIRVLTVAGRRKLKRSSQNQK